MKTAFFECTRNHRHGTTFSSVAEPPIRVSCGTLATSVQHDVAELVQDVGHHSRRSRCPWLRVVALIAVVAVVDGRPAAWAQEYEVSDAAVIDSAGAIVSDTDMGQSDSVAAEEQSRWDTPEQWDETSPREEAVQWEEDAPLDAGLPVQGAMTIEGDVPLEGELPTGCDPVACAVPDVGPMCCSVSRWSHRNRLFGEFLFLRPRDADVTYAMPVDGPVTPPGNPANPGNQVGRAGIVDPDFQPAIRVGFERAWDECSGIVATFTYFESNTANAVAATPGDFIQSQVTHPGALNAEDNWLEGSATLDVDYKLIDVDYRWLVSSGDQHAVNLLVGARYAQLTQDFHAQFAVNGTRDVDTRLQFEGGGLRIGLDAERYAACTGWMVYGRGNASFVAGDFRGDYFQGSSFAATEIDTAWKAGRIVTMLDLELGVGWTGPCDRVRLRAGYLISGWLNTVRTDEWIDAVNANQMSNLGGSGMTFDGLTARAEFRF
jgi:hypothetical protein